MITHLVRCSISVSLVLLGTACGHQTDRGPAAAVSSSQRSAQDGVAQGGAPAPRTTFKFDFGGSAVAEGFVDPGVGLYAEPGGFGWNLPVRQFIRSGPDLLRRDGVWAMPDGNGLARTFCVAMPDGDYDVHVIIGDQDFGRDNITVTLNGTFAGITNHLDAGEFYEATFPTTVVGGHMLVTMDVAAPNMYSVWVLNALEIWPR